MGKKQKGQPGGIATAEQNKKLEHTMGGSTTRDDAHDLGVPMLPGDGSEPQGPEDALGEGPKRGDYRERIGPEGYRPHEMKANPNAEELTQGEAQGDDADGTMDPDASTGAYKEPPSIVVDQRANAEDIGEVAGKKGGVETAEDA